MIASSTCRTRTGWDRSIPHDGRPVVRQGTRCALPSWHVRRGVRCPPGAASASLRFSLAYLSSQFTDFRTDVVDRRRVISDATFQISKPFLYVRHLAPVHQAGTTRFYIVALEEHAMCRPQNARPCVPRSGGASPTAWKSGVGDWELTRKPRRFHDLRGLPEMTTLVRDHRGEPASKRKEDPRRGGGPHARAREVETVCLAQTIDVLHLIGAERRHDLAARARRGRLEHGRRFHAHARRRLEHPHEHPREPPVDVRAVTVQPLADRVGDPFVELRQIEARGDVEMIDALRDRPRLRRRLPRKLIVGQVRDQRIRFVSELFELAPERVDLRRQCEVRRCRHQRRL